MPAELTPAQARRVALAAQGFGGKKPAKVGVSAAQRVIDQIAQFQLDTVNVAVRAAYVPLFARLGNYDRTLFDQLSASAPRRLFEYWGHAASYIDVQLFPALRQRMLENSTQPWPQITDILREHPQMMDQVLQQITAAGPLTARQLNCPDDRQQQPWWNWSAAKLILEWFLNIGTVSSAGRNTQFERRYDLTERVIPQEIFTAEPLSELGAWTALVRRCAQALGISDAASLADYFRIDRKNTNAAITELVASGELLPTTIKGSTRAYYLWHEARVPSQIHTDAIVSPFDSLAFHRDRLLDLFGVDYRIEIYLPAAKRTYGYYVYLFVSDDRISARVDLKADRKRKVLMVQAAWLEPGAPPAETARRLMGALRKMSDWLGLGEVQVAEVGTLSSQLRRYA
ncbi:MAG: winged helix DNA-binding domain-containing protein [Propionibacteriaceae bacterium]|nr:winged helix DNA-binding domain-containing protein [Propionibacteriaceae bacterium]